MILEGPPGIGRTSLWRSGVDLARDRGCRLLVARPAEAEAALSFSVLGDLLRETLAGGPEALPAPQRHALEAALLLAEPTEAAPNALAVSLAVHGVLRLLAQPDPLVIAIDDVQWTDPPSARALEFALRRSEGELIGVLASSLRGVSKGPLALEEVVPAGRIRSVSVGPLGVEDMGRVLNSALGHRHPRHVVARLHSASGGNPLYAIEIARALELSGRAPEAGAPLPVPDSLRGVLRERLKALDAATRDVLLAVALMAEPDQAAVAGAVGSEDVARAARRPVFGWPTRSWGRSCTRTPPKSAGATCIVVWPRSRTTRRSEPGTSPRRSRSPTRRWRPSSSRPPAARGPGGLPAPRPSSWSRLRPRPRLMSRRSGDGALSSRPSATWTPGAPGALGPSSRRSSRRWIRGRTGRWPSSGWAGFVTTRTAGPRRPVCSGRRWNKPARIPTWPPRWSSTPAWRACSRATSPPPRSTAGGPSTGRAPWGTRPCWARPWQWPRAAISCWARAWPRRTWSRPSRWSRGRNRGPRPSTRGWPSAWC